MFICRHDSEAVHFSRGDDESVARVIMDRWKMGGGDAHIQFEREHSKPMMLDNFLKPLLWGTGQLQFSFGHLDGDFKTADG